MKLYYFMIIAIGIMFTLNLSGVDTGSSIILDKLLLKDNVNASINPSVSGNSPTDVSGAEDFWSMIKTFFIVAIGLSIVGAFIGGQRSESIINAVASGTATFLFSMFAIDIFSVLKLMYSITGGAGWIFNITWIIIVPFLFGFGYSLIQFIMGTE